MAVSKIVQKDIVQLYKNGLSMMQIAQKLHLSISVARYWLDKKKIKRRSISEAITNLYITKFHKQPFRLKKNLSKNDQELKIAGIMLYWGEGSKTGNAIKFTNSDPKMIKLFVNFLRKICGISNNRLKALIHIYPDHNNIKLQKFWSEIIKIPLNQFYKSHIHKGEIGTYKYKSQYGTVAINYADKKLFEILLLWIEQYQEKLSKI